MQNQNTNDILAELENFSFETSPSQEASASFDILENISLQNETQENLVGEEETELPAMEIAPALPEDVLASFDTPISQNDAIESTPIEKQPSKILDGIIFFIKYIATSGTIFGVLLLTTNYSAYVEIAKSYLNPEGLQANQQSLLASVNGASIESEKKVQEELSTAQKAEMVKNKTYHSMDKLMQDSKALQDDINIEITPYENRIIIPKIAKNIPLVDVENKYVQNTAELDNIFMDELSKWVVRYPGTAKPGEVGNSFIFGHSSNFPWIKGEYNDVFALLDKVEFGDEIITYYNQKKFIYKVREKRVIKPGDISVLKRDHGKKEISIMTCWPVGTTLNRMIVIGELVEVQ